MNRRERPHYVNDGMQNPAQKKHCGENAEKKKYIYSMVKKNKKKRAGTMRWTWYKGDDRIDEEGRKPQDDQFDETRLRIPANVKAQMKPVEKQYWDIKRMHMDKVIFFKLGSFYVLYEEDAEIGKRLFDLVISPNRDGSPNMYYAGVGAKAIEIWIKKFLQKGYNVGVVEEMETKSAVGGTLIKRELGDRIYTPGTVSDITLISDDPESRYIIALKYEIQRKNQFGAEIIGICIAEMSTGQVYVGNFEDDQQFTHLQTILQQMTPREILVEKQGMPKHIKQIINRFAGQAKVIQLKCEVQFWTAEKTMQHCQAAHYFKEFPKILENANTTELSAFGAMVSHIKTINQDEKFLKSANIHPYSKETMSSSVIIDGQTLCNLEIFLNQDTNDVRGSLFDSINYCLTSAGVRKLKKWVAHPLKNIQHIQDRQNSMKDFEDVEFHNEGGEIVKLMKMFPDVERTLNTFTSTLKSYPLTERGNGLGHDRIFLVERTELRKKKLFWKLYEALCQYKLWYDKIKLQFHDHMFHSSLLRNVVLENEKDHQMFYKLESLLRTLQDNLTLEHFDDIKPKPRALPQYDELGLKIDRIKESLVVRLRSISEKLKTPCNFAKNDTFEIEISNKVNVGMFFPNLQKSKMLKHTTRYVDPFLNHPIDRLQQYETLREQLACQYLNEMYQNIVMEQSLIQSLSENIATFDCLYSIYEYSERLPIDHCIPIIEPFTFEHGSYLHIEGMEHPNLLIGRSFIPNDVHIGYPNSYRSMIVTGPNMGGKSTVLRLTCLISIMAHIGYPLPATACTMTVQDRIFTRIGACDRIMRGESTFMVEMLETSSILRHATNQSLVILDELGRGTSTYDGYAIAYSSLLYLVHNVKCLTLFSTHYHQLTKEFINDPDVAIFKLDYQLRPSQHPPIFFLYKLVEGRCEDSYGMNVARMVGISEDVIQLAESVSRTAQAKMDETESSLSSIESLDRQSTSLFGELFGKSYTTDAMKEKLPMLTFQIRDYLSRYDNEMNDE